MTPLELSELMNELPDDLIVSANRSKSERKRPFIRMRYVLPAAACALILICAAVYPKLHAAPPDRIIVTDSTQTVTTVSSTAATSAVTESSSDSGTAEASFSPETTVSQENTLMTSTFSDQHSITTGSFSTAVETTASAAVSGTQFSSDSSSEISSTTAQSSTETKPSSSAYETTAPPNQIPYTLEKKKCLLPVPPAGAVTDPLTGEPVPFTAQVDSDGETWDISLAEPCEDACILSGNLINGILYLSVACLAPQTDDYEASVCFSLTFPPADHPGIAEIRVVRRDCTEIAAYQRLDSDAPMILYEP